MPIPPFIPFVKEPEWFYLDQEDKTQGPFSSAQMRDWYRANFLKGTVRVRQATDPDTVYTPLSERDCCFTRPAPPVPPTFPMLPGFRPPFPMQPNMQPNMIGFGNLNHQFPANMATNPRFPSAPAASAPNSKIPDYAQAAAFGAKRFMFASQGAEQSANARHWQRKGLPDDKDGRHMNHYFDFDSWQDQNQGNSAGVKKRKFH